MILNHSATSPTLSKHIYYISPSINQPAMTIYTLPFKDIGKKDINKAGGKGANLGEMFQIGIPVPNGFVVTADTYFKFVESAGIKPQLIQALANLDVDNSKALTEAAAACRQLIINAPFPVDIKTAITNAYHQLGKDQLVAIRSSATAEDLPEASFAGQQESYMNIKGAAEVIKTTQLTWASLFEDRAVFYRTQQGFDHLSVGIAIPIQIMVDSAASGVMFTLEPVTNDQSVISIEAVLGFGDAIVSGSITPDQYIIDKKTLTIKDKKIVSQTRMLVKHNAAGKQAKPFRPGSEQYWINVPSSQKTKPKISDSNIITLAQLGLKLEEHYHHPQDIEWAINHNGSVFIVQTRPVTTINHSTNQSSVNSAPTTPISPPTKLPNPILEGLGASPGIATGPIKNIKDASQINQVKPGDILVTGMTTPDFVPAMRRAVAVITDFGGRTSHAAIVSRELSIPAIVGTEKATKILKTGQTVTVNGRAGLIYTGKVNILDTPPVSIPTPNSSDTTRTKVYCNLGEPQLAEKIAQKNVDGVGLLRAEFMIANIGYHPRYLLETGHRESFIDKLYQDLFTFAKAFAPRPVIYRATDFKTNEYASLKGGEKFEKLEANPMIGFRGVSRYIADPKVFLMELAAIKRVRQYHKNIWLMLPFVRRPDEIPPIKEILYQAGLYQSKTFKLLIMVEVPSAVVMLEQFIGLGIDGVSIGSNDLTQLMLGLDRDNAKIANLFDELHPAVLWAIRHTIKTCREHGLYSGICGQAPSEYPELVEKLVEWGISSISVSPDVIERTRDLVRLAEAKQTQATSIPQL